MVVLIEMQIRMQEHKQDSRERDMAQDAEDAIAVLVTTALKITSPTELPLPSSSPTNPPVPKTPLILSTSPGTAKHHAGTATSSKCKAGIQTEAAPFTVNSGCENEMEGLKKKLEDQGRTIEALEQWVGDLEELEKQRVAQHTRYSLRPLILATCTVATFPPTIARSPVGNIPHSTPQIAPPMFPPGLQHPPHNLNIPQPLESDPHPSISPLTIPPLHCSKKTPKDRSTLLVLNVDTKPPMTLTWPLLLVNSVSSTCAYLLPLT
jgi:hypothetical protein